MSQIIVRLIASIIEIFFVTYALRTIQNEKCSIRDLSICILLYLPSFFFLDDNNSKMYIIKNIYLVLIFIIFLFKRGVEISDYIPIICALLSISGILKILIGIISGVVVSFMTTNTYIIQTLGPMVSFLLMGIVGIVLIKRLENRIKDSNFLFSKKYVACFIYFLIVCVKIPFLYTDIEENRTIKAMCIVAICCTIIFFVISRIDKHNAEKEKAKIEENNKKLSTKLHKSQEILPAMVQVLEHVTKNGGTEMEEQKAHKLLKELSDLYGHQLKENSKEDLQLKNFCSTGLMLLDQQLKVYQMEALDRNVNLDIFVQTPINELIKKENIDQWKLQRAVGDLVRNAFRAMEGEDKKYQTNGHILLIIGCQYEDILEIAVVDNGTDFPLYVIEAFGSRGVTTGGTGNGLADLVEFADETKASIRVDEFDGKTSLFTKKVSIIFDKQRKNYFNSSRKENVGSSFWDVL